jgi:hypothetical protein
MAGSSLVNAAGLPVSFGYPGRAGADGRFLASAISRRDSPLARHCRGYSLRHSGVLQAD